MMINQLICRAASVYPEAGVLDYWDMEEGGPRENRDGGDSLARFIAMEIADTFDEGGADLGQVRRAAGAIRAAADELSAVAFALERMENEVAAA